MKNAHGVFLDGILYLGGGYTGSSKTDLVVHAHNFTSGKWSQLPPCPIKWSALCVHENRLVLVGGREKCENRLALCTNRIAVWYSDSWRWECTLPPMIVSRMSPVVISHREHLIVAGGKKGSLDYNAEVLLARAERWAGGPALPLPCHAHTSTTLGGVWYLLDQKSGTVQYATISTYVKMVGKEEDSSDADRVCGNIQLPNGGLHCNCNHKLPSHQSNLWNKMDSSPPVIPFRIASTNSHLLAFSEAQGLISAHVYEREMWSSVESRLPSTLSSGLVLAGDGGRGALYVIGGQVGHTYSNMSYRLALMTHEDLRLIKKNRHTTLSLSE